MKNDVNVKSTIKAIVVMNVPTLNLKKTWSKKGAVQKIPFDLLEQAIYEPGVEYLFKSGILYIDDLDTKIQLGLEEEGEEELKILLIDDKTAKHLLENVPLKEFRETVEKISHDQAIELAKTAIDMRINDYQRAKILKEKTSIDVFGQIIKLQEEEEIEEKK